MPEIKELVINTTPIISLIAATGSLDMLPLLYGRVWVPIEVCREIQAGVRMVLPARNLNKWLGYTSKASL